MVDILAELLKSITEAMRWVIPSVWGVGMALTINKALKYKEDGRLVVFTSMAGIFVGYFGFNYNFHISPENLDVSKKLFAGIGGCFGGTILSFLYANSSAIYESILKTAFDFLKDKFKPKTPDQ